jgi:hypothetical protein
MERAGEGNRAAVANVGVTAAAAAAAAAAAETCEFGDDKQAASGENFECKTDIVKANDNMSTEASDTHGLHITHSTLTAKAPTTAPPSPPTPIVPFFTRKDPHASDYLQLPPPATRIPSPTEQQSLCS